jgi:hypothetical protein
VAGFAGRFEQRRNLGFAKEILRPGPYHSLHFAVRT